MAIILHIFTIWLMSTTVMAYPNTNLAENEQTTDMIDVVHGNDNDNDNYQDYLADTFEDFEDSIPVGDFLSPANQNLDPNDEVVDDDLYRNKRHGGYGGYVVYTSYPIYNGGYGGRHGGYGGHGGYRRGYGGGYGGHGGYGGGYGGHGHRGHHHHHHHG